jgi:hypothetical protein
MAVSGARRAVVFYVDEGSGFLKYLTWWLYAWNAIGLNSPGWTVVPLGSLIDYLCLALRLSLSNTDVLVRGFLNWDFSFSAMFRFRMDTF